MSAAKAMRELSLVDRNALIAGAGDKVLDLRPALANRMTQRIIAEGHRQGLTPTISPTCG